MYYFFSVVCLHNLLKKTGHKMINMRLIKRIQLFIPFVYLVYV